MDQNESWHARRLWPWPYCVRWGPSSHSAKGAQPPIFTHTCCGQMAGWIKIPLGMEVGIGPGDFVLDGDPAPLSKKGAQQPNFRSMSIVAKRLHGSRWHLAWRCARWGPSSPAQKRGQSHPQFLVHFYCGQTADASRCHMLWR